MAEQSQRAAELQSVEVLHVRTGLHAGRSIPLGDAVASFTHATGLDLLAQKYTELTGKDCGCEGRREWLNQLIKY